MNHAKIRGLIEVLISPTLYFVKTLQDEEVDGQQSSNAKQYEVVVKPASNFKKIKENHMIMMITLAKRCLEDGEFTLAESVLNVI